MRIRASESDFSKSSWKRDFSENKILENKMNPPKSKILSSNSFAISINNETRQIMTERENLLANNYNKNSRYLREKN